MIIIREKPNELFSFVLKLYYLSNILCPTVRRYQYLYEWNDFTYCIKNINSIFFLFPKKKEKELYFNYLSPSQGKFLINIFLSLHK